MANLLRTATMIQTVKSLTAWRIADSRHPIFSGQGAAQYGSRWNSPGNAVIYCSLSYAGCLIEKLTHTGINKIPKRQAWIQISIKDLLVEEIHEHHLPGWNLHDYIASRSYGDSWLMEKRTVALIVPSLPGAPIEKNLLINPAHQEFAKITYSKEQPVFWDERLFR